MPPAPRAQVVADAAVVELNTQIAAKRGETEKERKRKERLERELKELKANVEARQAEIKARSARVSTGVGEIGALEGQLREQKQLSDRAVKEVDGLTQKARLPAWNLFWGGALDCRRGELWSHLRSEPRAIGAT